MTAPRAVLFDLDGTLYQEGGALPGAIAVVETLRARGLTVGYVTNTTSRSRRLLLERLRGYGFPGELTDIETALLAGASHLRRKGVRRVAPLVPDTAFEDLAEFELTHHRPEAVLVGDLDDRWDFAILNRAFQQVMDGAELVALSRDRYWRADIGLQLDAGAFVAALEYASGKSAALCGKPAGEFYAAALAALAPGRAPAEVLMVGDDLWGDIEGAQRAGLRTCLVRTGKYRPEVFAASGIQPDLVVDSVADLPAHLIREFPNPEPDSR